MVGTDKLNIKQLAKQPQTATILKGLNNENLNQRNLFDQIKLNINKTAGLELSNMAKKLNDIDPITLKLENKNVKMVLPMPNDKHSYIIVEQELFSKIQNTKTILSRAYYGSDNV